MKDTYKKFCDFEEKSYAKKTPKKYNITNTDEKEIISNLTSKNLVQKMIC